MLNPHCLLCLVLWYFCCIWQYLYLAVFCEIYLYFQTYIGLYSMNFECHERLWWCSGCVVPSPISEVSKNYKYLLDSHQWQFYEKWHQIYYNYCHTLVCLTQFIGGNHIVEKVITDWALPTTFSQQHNLIHRQSLWNHLWKNCHFNYATKCKIWTNMINCVL